MGKKITGAFHPEFMRLENPKSFGFSPNISRRGHDRVYEEGF
jgi:hypothetical protein